MRPDANPVETARRAEKVTKLVAVFKEYKIQSSDVSMIVHRSDENDLMWKKLSAAIGINPPSHKTKLLVVQALRDSEIKS